jgi:hypothetical protein
VKWSRWRHLAYLWLPTPHRPVETTGLVGQQQAGATVHGKTRSSGGGLLQEKAHHQQQPSFPLLSQSGTRPGGGTSRPNLRGGNYLHKASPGVYLSGGASGCVHPLHSGMPPERNLSQDLTQVTLQKAVIQHTPGIHHSGHRGQYAATAHVPLSEEAGVQISMAEVSQAWQNGYAERIMRTIKEEEVDLSEYEGYWEPTGRLVSS